MKTHPCHCGDPACNPNIPLYACIAANGGLFTLAFRATKHSTQSHEGYSAEQVFADFFASHIPCVDFRPMNFSGYHYPSIREHASCLFGGEVAIADWLKDVAARGAVITYL